MRDAEGGCGAGLLQSLASFLQELLVAEAGDETAFLLQSPAGSDGRNDGPAQFREALTRECGNTQRASRVHLGWQVALISCDDAFPLLLGFFDQLPVRCIQR